MDRWTRKLGPHPFSLLFTGLFALIFGSLLVYLCVILGADRPAVGLNLLVALLGALSGWAVGMIHLRAAQPCATARTIGTPPRSVNPRRVHFPGSHSRRRARTIWLH